jgi:imidazolonepropionase-like amidohydrolase
MRLVVLATVIACSAHRAPAPAPPGIATTWVHVGHGAGTLTMTSAPDGMITSTLSVPGKGLVVEARQRLATDGTLAAFATGGEMFTRTDGVARWKSAEETGESTVTGPAMYLPNASMPHVIGYLVHAALANGGTLRLLPGGEARVSKVAEQAVKAGGDTKWLACYAITGIDLVPVYTWMEGTTWFGSVQANDAFVPRGWESAVAPLLAKQNTVERTRSSELAKKQAHRPPPLGLAYTHAKVFDAATRAWLVDHTVVVLGDVIMAVGPSASTAVPTGAEVVDLAGKALIPGLIDMHAHLHRADGALHIAAGVTTVRDLGNDEATLDRLKKAFDNGTAIGPHVVRWGRIEGSGPKAIRTGVRAATADAARAAVELFAKRGYEGIKIYGAVDVALVPVITKHAHARGLAVTGHVPAFMLAEEAIAAGFDGIEHMNTVFLNFLATRKTDTRDATRFTLVGERGGTIDLASNLVRDFIELLRAKHIVIDPTLVVLERRFTGAVTESVGRLPTTLQRQHARDRIAGDKSAVYRASWDRMLQMVKLMHDNDVPIVIGSDSTAGLMLHRELELFAQAGLANNVILEIATLGNARALKLDAKIGSIAVGKRADLVVVDGDPLADIRSIKNVVSTMRAGTVFLPKPLYESVGVKP